MKEETNEIEVWKLIPGFTNYEASTMGRIRTRTTGRILTQTINQVTGYVNLSLKQDDGKYIQKYVHRLVLQTFKPIPNMDELQCDHINNDRQDNRISNLQWLSRKENNSKPHAIMMRKINHNRKTHPNEFIKGTRNEETIWFINQADASRKLGCSKPAITKGLNGETKRVQGWILKYVPRTENPELMNKVIEDKQNRKNRNRNREIQLTIAKRKNAIEMKQNLKNEKEKLNKELSNLIKEFKIASDKSSELWKQILRLRKQIEELDYQKRKWDMHAINQYDMEGNLIKEWRCASDIKKELGIDVSQCVKGFKESESGSIWKYKVPRNV